MTPAAFSLEPAICVMMDIKGPFVITVYVIYVLVFNGKRNRRNRKRNKRQRDISFIT